MWQTIVVGSGIGGLAAAAALAKCGKRVLLLEQHTVAGGQTQTFRRHDWVFCHRRALRQRCGPASGRFHEAATPLTQRRFVRAVDGAMYGLEVSVERQGSDAIKLRTPVPGLLLAGQDVVGPGVQAAFMGGLMAAATVEPVLWRKLGE